MTGPLTGPRGEVRLADGRRVRLRAVEPEDKRLLAAAFDELSEESRHRRARDEGVKRFSAIVLAENRDAIGLVETLGDATCEQSGSVLRVDLELPGPTLRELLRAGAAGRLGFTQRGWSTDG